MKKVLSLIIVLCLSLGAAAFAEETPQPIDFSGYSLEELLEIKEALMAEIASRPGGGRTELAAGQYIIGVDLEPGVYSAWFLQNGDPDIARSDYYVYENESMYRYDVDRLWLGDMPRVEGSLKGDGEVRLTLYPGELFRLSYNGAAIERTSDAPARDESYEVPEGTTIPKGQYTVGDEIPAGIYNVYYSGTTTSRVRVYQDAEEADNTFSDPLQESILNAANTSGRVNLSEGNIIRVEYTDIIMTKGAAFVFD